MIGDLLVPRNFVGNLDFFTASFTAERDDLGQWRAYADNGRGFALGFAPKMFEVVDGAGLEPNEMSFVGPVLYDRQAIFARHRPRRSSSRRATHIPVLWLIRTWAYRSCAVWRTNSSRRR
jgi:Protein of unknown function (DUF2971)